MHGYKNPQQGNGPGLAMETAATNQKLYFYQQRFQKLVDHIGTMVRSH